MIIYPADKREDAIDRAARERARPPSRATVESYLDFLEERDYLLMTSKGIVPTKKFADLIVETTQDINEMPFRIDKGDDPREVFAWEMARTMLGLNSQTIQEGRNAEEMGRLASVVFKLLHFYFNDPEILRQALDSCR